MNETWLAHHGIKGQKWGVRRFQNEDGTLTAKGRKRYGEDLDINDKSRVNIAKIRLGEARRKLDVAMENNPSNNTRIAELRARERSAKSAVREMKKVDKGAKLAAKGQTITGNGLKASLAMGAAYLGSIGLNAFLNSRVESLRNQGILRAGHIKAGQLVNDIGSYGMYAIATGYGIKQEINNSRIRAYEKARTSGKSSIKYAGSTEYEDAVKRRKGK